MKNWDISEPITDYEHSNNNAGGKYDGKLVLRPSSLESYIRCPYAFYKQQILGEYGAPNSASQVGTALHAVMEDAILYRLETGKNMELDEMQRRGVKHWKELNDKAKIQYHGEQTYQTMADDLYAGVIALREALDCIEATAAEGRYSAKIKDHPMFSAISGSLDVETGANVVDLKFTGKKKSKPDDYVLQQSTYVWLKQINGIPAEKFTILNIVRPTKAKKLKDEQKGIETVADWHLLEGKPNVDYVKHWVNIILNKTEKFANYRDSCGDLVARGDMTAEEAKQAVEDFAALEFQGTSPSNSFLCSSVWCSHWKTCPHVKAIRENEKIEEVTLW